MKPEEIKQNEGVKDENLTEKEDKRVKTQKIMYKERKGGKHEEKVISRDSGTCIVFYKYAPPRPYLRKNLLPEIRM